MGKSWRWLYYGTIILFWILFLYDGFIGRDVGTTFMRIIRPLWSPSNDPVLNFIIDAVIVILGLPIAIGMLVTGFYLLIGLIVFGLSFWFLSWLASISITGAILSASIVVGIVFLIVKSLMNNSDTGMTSDSSYSDYSSSVVDSYNSTSEPEVNPIFRATKIDKAILSDDKILRDSSGKVVGSLEKAILSNGQIIRDSSGKKVGEIEQSIWDKDIQIIRGPDGKKEGEIKTNFWGDRVIVDSKGEKVGEIGKNIWGETVIKKR